MHLRHLNHPFTAAHESGKLGFVVDAISNDDKCHYFECNQNDDDDELTTPVNRIKMINLTFPVKGSRFVGSCNGLMCFAGGALVWICNPIITGEYVMLPKINSYCTNIYLYECWNVGFGYVSATNKYKVVAAGVHVTETSSEVYVYTLGSGKSWRELGKFNYGWVTNRYQLQGREL